MCVWSAEPRMSSCSAFPTRSCAPVTTARCPWLSEMEPDLSEAPSRPTIDGEAGSCNTSVAPGKRSFRAGAAGLRYEDFLRRFVAARAYERRKRLRRSSGRDRGRGARRFRGGHIGAPIGVTIEVPLGDGLSVVGAPSLDRATNSSTSAPRPGSSTPSRSRCPGGRPPPGWPDAISLEGTTGRRRSSSSGTRGSPRPGS